MKRRTTELKAALVGVMLESSFTRFIASMATFNERAPFHPFGRLDLVPMAQS